MPDDNLPADAGTVDDAPLSVDTATDKLTNLFESDPETDLTPKDQGEQTAAEADKPEDDDPLGMKVEAEDVENPEEPEEADGSDDIKGGRFAPDSAKVKLADGRTITVADLKSHAETRIKEFQRGFTEKSKALSEDRKAFDAEKTRVSEYAQSLDQFRDYAAWYAEHYLPKAPEPFDGDPEVDPLGYMKWTKARDAYMAHAQAFEAFKQSRTAEDKRKSEETTAAANARLETERAALLKAMPVLKDPVKGKQVWDAMVSGASEHFKITPEEVNSVADHRLLVALRDAIAYRRLQREAPTARTAVAQRPAITAAPRGNPGTAAKQERQTRTERLRSTGSIDDAAAVLRTFDL